MNNKSDSRSPFFRRTAGILRGAFDLIAASVEKFIHDGGFSRSGSLAYTTLLSCVPVSALSIGLLATFSVSRENVQTVLNTVFKQFVPVEAGVQEVPQYLQELSRKYLGELNAAAGTVNVVGFLLLILIGVSLLNAVEKNLNHIWQVYETRKLAGRIAIFSSVVLLAPIFLGSVYFSAHFTSSALLSGSERAVIKKIYEYCLPFIIDALFFTVIYLMVPKAPVKFRHALGGAVVAAVLFDAAKRAFTAFVVEFSVYGKVYGALAAIPVFLVWIYLTWVIVLFGAEISFHLKFAGRELQGLRRSIFSAGDGELLLGLQALLEIAAAFKHGNAPPDSWELADNLGCSPSILNPVLERLLAAGFISRSDSGRLSFCLQRAPELITVAGLNDAISGSGSRAAGRKAVLKAFSALDTGNDKSCTLSSLLE